MKRISCLLLLILLVLPFGSALASETALQTASLPYEYIGYYAQNEARYQVYAQSNPNMGLQSCILAVNLKLDEGNYKNILTTGKPEAIDVFVNKHYALPRSYKPENLMAVDRKYAVRGVRLREDCYAAFLQMAEAMELEGLTLYIQSGYRTNRKRGGANSLWYAWPGHSEHQTGLAFDLRKKNVSYTTLSQYKYEKTKEYAWLSENAHTYGFVLSYPKDMTWLTGFAFEPWHWRYVGTEITADMREKGIKTFQQYWALYLYSDAIKNYA